MPYSSVFVAGATGLAGDAILERLLLDPTVEKIVATCFTSRPQAEDPRLEWRQVDLRSPQDCARAAAGCQAAVMAAAVTGGAAMQNDEPWKMVTDNLIMDTAMLDGFHLAGVQKVVFVSSATVYQDFAGFISEDELDWNLDPAPAYMGVGWAKRSAEKLCRFWHEKTGIRVAVARSSNIYGPRAKFDQKTANFIPALIRKAEDRMDPFEVWGSGDVTRDVIYSKDFGEAVYRLLMHPDILFDTFNLGHGKTVTVEEVVTHALQAAGHEPARINYIGEKTTIIHRALDCTKLMETIAWTPGWPIEVGIEETAAWWRENKDTWKK
ncbi:NAD(P)-dependent oxidoreductase [uncultured Pseudodesulfovibrio sp.]|uniref:NAD-dependent epimerase/dehydratase family protein n=1 Tax=uncultured Pseudodesulfovibrio sp. TaxID=2035858 RepID=UPI0029C7CD73|nr:NAD(P)-dependent oxidoreductase [uncultured Pseudodesulfovibrio sp.]